MTGRYYYLAGIVLTAAVLVATALAYPLLPTSVARHWDLHGVPNGYMPKWALYFVPGIMTVLMLFARALPWLSPQQFEVEGFHSTYLRIMLITVSMLAYLDAVTLWIGIGRSLNLRQAVLAAVCLLFVLQGNVLGKVRRNFFIGIRTPWTLANERVWNATHRLAAKTFVLAGLAGLALIAMGLDSWPPVAALVAAALIPAAYSLIYSKQFDRRGER
jgi:uncharacterized membrane protein